MIKSRFLLLAVAVLLVAVACGDDDEAGTTTQGTTATTSAAATTAAPATTAAAATTAAPVDVGCIFAVEDDAVIVFSGWGDDTEQQIYRDSIARFAEVCPAVTVDYQPIPADFQTKLTASMAGGAAPDVFYVDAQLMTAFGPTGQLLALDDIMAEGAVTRADFIPALLTIFTLDGATYALPKDWGTLGLVYLPAAFAAAGIDEPTADWTWDDLKAAAETIAANTDFGGFCQNADWARFAPWAYSNGGSFTNDAYSAATIDTAAVTDAASYILGMKDSGALVSSGDLGAGWCGEAIGKELAGMTYEGGWMVNYMRNDFPDVDWKAVPLPAGSEGKADIIFTNGIGVNANSAFPRAAAAFTIYVTGRVNQAEIVATGFAYSTHPDQVDLVVDPNDAAIAIGGTFELSGVAYWGPSSGRVQDAVSQALERIYLGDQTVAEAIAQAQTEIQTALDEAG